MKPQLVLQQEKPLKSWSSRSFVSKPTFENVYSQGRNPGKVSSIVILRNSCVSKPTFENVYCQGRNPGKASSIVILRKSCVSKPTFENVYPAPEWRNRIFLTTNGLMCSKCVSPKWNEAIDNDQWYNILLNFIL